VFGAIHLPRPLQTVESLASLVKQIGIWHWFPENPEMHEQVLGAIQVPFDPEHAVDPDIPKQTGVWQSFPVYPELQAQESGFWQTPLPLQTVGSLEFLLLQTLSWHCVPVCPVVQLQLFGAIQVPFTPEQAVGFVNPKQVKVWQSFPVYPALQTQELGFWQTPLPLHTVGSFEFLPLQTLYWHWFPA
jgi:hypothetical protein